MLEKFSAIIELENFSKLSEIQSLPEIIELGSVFEIIRVRNRLYTIEKDKTVLENIWSETLPLWRNTEISIVSNLQKSNHEEIV